ncbi:nucleotide exchange factor GrpE [Candidatus Woesearchaeota archaeon]|nr:nucleotide exchange factor GrpE [Candidatus Woesearchaeota archaeon]
MQKKTKNEETLKGAETQPAQEPASAVKTEKTAENTGKTSKTQEKTQVHQPVHHLDKELLAKEQNITELTELLQRLQAEFENYKKRVDKEKQEFCKLANAEFVSKLLPILDSFGLALKNKDQEEDFVKGVELIYSQLFDVLEKQGLRPIQALGRKFDPYSHEALLQQESDKEDNIVLEELQTGYMFNNRLVRTSKVKISKKLNKTNGNKNNVNN